jgi:hypothetical protein
MKRTKKKRQFNVNKGGSKERCSFSDDDAFVNKNGISDLLKNSFFLKGESFGFTDFFKKTLVNRCNDQSLLSCYDMLNCFNSTKDLSDMLFDIFEYKNDSDVNKYLDRFVKFFIIVIDILYEYKALFPKNDPPILLSALSRQFDVIFNYQSQKERVLKYMRALITNDKVVLNEFNDSPVGDATLIEKNRDTMFKKGKEKALLDEIKKHKEDIIVYYNDRMELFMEENKQVKLYQNPDFSKEQKQTGKGFGGYFIVFVVGMLGLSFIVERSITFNRRDTFYI